MTPQPLATSFTSTSPRVPIRHTWDANAERPWVMTDEDHPYLERDARGLVDLTRCGCVAVPYLLRDVFNRVEQVIVEHETGCGWFAQFPSARSRREPPSPPRAHGPADQRRPTRRKATNIQKR